MEIVDDGTTAQIEEILAQAATTGASSLPSTDVRQRMLNRYPLAQFAAPFRSLLALAQFDQQGFIGMDADTATPGTGGALGFQRALV